MRPVDGALKLLCSIGVGIVFIAPNGGVIVFGHILGKIELIAAVRSPRHGRRVFVLPSSVVRVGALEACKILTVLHLELIGNHAKRLVVAPSQATVGRDLFSIHINVVVNSIIGITPRGKDVAIKRVRKSRELIVPPCVVANGPLRYHDRLADLQMKALGHVGYGRRRSGLLGGGHFRSGRLRCGFLGGGNGSRCIGSGDSRCIIACIASGQKAEQKPHRQQKGYLFHLDSSFF